MTRLLPTSWAIDCAGARHHLRWQDGRLTALEHPDPDRERALTALGGQPYRCLQLLQVWEQHIDDLDVLLLEPQDRYPSDDHHAHPGPHRGRAHYGWTAYAPLSSSRAAATARPVGLPDVLRLGGGLPDRLAAQVIDAWSARVDADDAAVGAARPRLHAALYGRFAAAVRSWLGDPALRIDLTMTPRGSATAIERDDDRLRVQLPFQWLADVWLPGFATVADRLSLSVQQATAHRHELLAVDRDLTTYSTITVETHEHR